MPKSNHLIECRVSFRTGEGRAFAEVCLDDESLINRLVLHPMTNAKRDPKPAEYAVLGTLELISSDEHREHFVLFSPWGHYKHDKEYFVADFGDLQAACEESLRNAQTLLMQQERRNDKGPKSSSDAK